MSNRDFKLQLREALFRMPVVHYSSTNPTQIVVRCPLCGDSIKDYNHAHFSIKIDIDDDDMPILFQCFRCKSGGILNSDILHQLDIYDLNMAGSLKRYNARTVKIQKKKIGYDFEKLNYKVPEVKPTTNNMRKIKYINNRLGIKLNQSDIERYKIVCSFKDFLEYNKIEEITCHKNVAVNIEKDYVGFLSMKNNYIIFRDITNTNKYRVIKYRIHDTIFTESTYYTIPSTIDIFSPKEINIYVAEGTFDILGVYNHVVEDRENSIFLATTSGNYVTPLMDILKIGIVGNVNIHIFADSDGTSKEKYFNDSVLPVVSPWVNHVYLYYNTLEKDCGVPKDKIDLSRKKIK